MFDAAVTATPQSLRCGPRNPRGWSPALTLIISLALAGTAQGQSNSARTKAATTTASSSAACKALPSFYWEIGDRNARLASGTRGLLAPKANTVMPIYSATKWLFGTYAYEQRGGQMADVEVQHLTLSSGVNGSSQCTLAQSVAGCRDEMGAIDAAAVGKFHYGPGPLQQLAVDLGLGGQTTAQLSASLRGLLGSDIPLSFTQPQVASGARMSAADYGLFLRKILGGRLLLSGGALGSAAVCTYTSATSADTGRTQCPTSTYSPTDGASYTLNEQWSYALGHWVESDPVKGDGAFSSPGAAGFYPWIDSSRSYYGVLARNMLTLDAAKNSVACGRLIRAAWMTGIAQK